jgi:SAM-dependent methyltransferase
VADEPGPRLGTVYRVELLRRLGVDGATGTVVDVGGRDGRWLARMGGTLVVVDPEPVRAADAVSYVNGSADALPLRDHTADVVYSLDVIEHTPDEHAALREMVRVMRPGGRLVITTPSDGMRVFPGLSQSWLDGKWGHDRVRGFSRTHLESLLRAEGLDVDVRPLAFRVFRTLYFPLRALWGISHQAGTAVVRAVAAVDARFPWGPHGALLVEAQSRRR